MSTGNKGGTNVLVVEDNDDLRELYVAQLLRNGEYSVERVANGAAALEQADDTTDVVLLDLGPPDTSGTDVLDRLNERESPPAVVVVTGRDERAMDGLDCAEQLTKPVGMAELVDIVDRVAAPSAEA
jgi:DNA-binding response OmpR family regulator